MKVKVTQRHINQAASMYVKLTNDCRPSEHCIINQALRDAFPRATIIVGYTHASVGANVYELTNAEQYTKLDKAFWYRAKPSEIEITKIKGEQP